MPAQVTLKNDAQLIEVFSSIQGEGTLVGCRQIFVRMAFCNLSCAYCDTPFAPQRTCRIESHPGSETFNELPNPVAFDVLSGTVCQWIDALPGAHHSLSVTGGEPLMQDGILAEWLPELRKLLPIYLETNGTMPQALRPLLPHIDWISMDLKLPSQTGLVAQWDEHREFLALAQDKNCFVKVVVGSNTNDEELMMAARLVHDVSPDLPLILQPVTTSDGILLSAKELLAMHALVALTHPPVRVIPQTHHFLNLL
ncbi:MAG TPA: 7-carboxy-7-deazaguanine synthase QueE [Geopsychrobacteraceae bacterium]|nr:7-carboxy-7-deazaguanine synthase QueE [Geopsychrobacteraceae bacterium]